MTRLTRPIDYSLGNSLDEVLKRRTNFATVMRPGVPEASHLARQTESSPTSRSDRPRRAKEVGHYVKNHPKEAGSVFWLPGAESISPTNIEPVSRHDKNPIRRESTTTRTSPERFPSPLTASSVTSRKIVPKKVEGTIHKTGKTSQSGRQSEVPNHGARQRISANSQSRNAVIGKAYDATFAEDIYSYVSSSSTDLASTAVDIEEPLTVDPSLGKSSIRKPPIPPKSKTELSSIRSEAEVKSAFQEFKTRIPSQPTLFQSRHHDASAAKNLTENRSKSPSVVDDENTTSSDIKFTYSPISSASFLTSTDDQRNAYTDASIPVSSVTAAGGPKANELQGSDMMPTEESDPAKSTGWAQRNALPATEEASMNSSMAVVVANDDGCSMNDRTPFEKDQKQPADNRTDDAEIRGVPRSTKKSTQTGHTKTAAADASQSEGVITAHSFASSLSSKPSTDEEEASSLAKKPKGIATSWGGNKNLSTSINDFTMETNTCDNSYESHDFGMSYEHFQGTGDNNDAGNSDNVFVSLYSDIVYLLVHGNKQEEGSERNIARPDEEFTSQIDSCASDTSGALDPEDDQTSLVETQAFCFLCGNHAARQPADLHPNWTLQEFKLSAEMEQSAPPCEARDVLTESECVAEEDSREPCPRETVHEIPKDYIPDVGIFDNESEESDDTDDECIAVTKHSEEGESTRGTGKQPPMDNTEKVEAVSYHKYFYWPSCIEQVKRESPEPLLQKAMATLGHRPAKGLGFLVQGSPTFINTNDFDEQNSVVQLSHRDSSESNNVQTNEIDDKGILEALNSITNRVQQAKSERPAPADLTQPFTYGTILPDIDRYMDSFEGPLAVLSRGAKDMVATELNAPVTTDLLHPQPVQELGESQNMYIELPVGEMPKPVLPPETFNWKKELHMLEDIVREEICCKPVDEEGGQIAIILRDKFVALSTSVVDVITDPLKGCTEEQIDVSEHMKQTFSDASNETSYHCEFVHEQDFVQNDQLRVLAWLASFQDVDIAHSRTLESAQELKENSKKTILPDLEEYLNQPTVNLDLEWQDIPVPMIEDLLLTSPSFQAYLSQPCSETPSELCLGWQSIHVTHLMDESPSIQDFLTQSSTTDTTGGDSWETIPLPQLKPLPLQDVLLNNENEGTEINLASHNLAFLSFTCGSQEHNEADAAADSCNDGAKLEFVVDQQVNPTSITEEITGIVQDETAGICNMEPLFETADQISHTIHQDNPYGNTHKEDASAGEHDQDSPADITELTLYQRDMELENAISKDAIDHNSPRDNDVHSDEAKTATIELLQPEQFPDLAVLATTDHATDID